MPMQTYKRNRSRKPMVFRPKQGQHGTARIVQPLPGDGPVRVERAVAYTMDDNGRGQFHYPQPQLGAN
jgi:hypothetical protein